MLTVVIISIFLLGIALIALEDKTGVNKSAIALLMSVLMWTTLSVVGENISAEVIAEQLGEVSETLFFVMGALLIVELVDLHGGFRVVQQMISTVSLRKLLWIIALLAFFFSAILDNIATAVIMVTLMRKFITERELRWLFSGMIILAANAGGSFSPVGDVTTILLWTGGNLTPWHQVSVLFFPALATLLFPLVLVSVCYIRRGAVVSVRSKPHQESHISTIHRRMILFLGVMAMALVPFFQEWVPLPPFMLILFGVAVLWVYTDSMYSRAGGGIPESERHTVSSVFSRLDMSTIMFFLGILMSVGAMKVAGILSLIGGGLEHSVGDPMAISFILGAMSSFVDNVALVAAAQGMYPVAQSGSYMVDSEFWTLIAYYAVNGGSLLVFGSATGVTVMGLEKLTFGYYLRRFTLLSLGGCLFGSLVYLFLV